MTARTRQPQWPASVNWSHPSTRSLIAAAYPVGAGLWLANKGTFHSAQSVSLNTGVTTHGRTVYGPNESVTNFIPLASDTFAAPITMLAAILPVGGGNAACTICSFGSGSSNGRIALQYGAVDLGNQYLRLVSSATAVLATDTFPAFSGANGVGSPEIVAATYAGTSAGYSFWHNGSKSSSGTTASTSALFDGFGALDSSTYPSYQGYTRIAGIFCWSRILSDDELQSLTTKPWQLFAPQRRLWIQLGAAAGGSETTGTLSGTDGADAAAFSGAESIPGSLAATDGADAATFSGTHVENATGTLAATDGADAAAFAGTETFTGTLAATDGADAAAFSGQHTEAGVIAGTLAATDGADAASFEGAQTISGTLAAVDGADSATFSGIHLQNITSTLDATDGADSATFSGTTAAEITGTLDATDGADEALFVSDQLGGRLLRRRRRYLVKDRIYDDLDPADVIAAAKEAGVDLGEVREVTKQPTAHKAKPRHADDDGREYWLPQEFWGRAARQQRQEATSPLPADFWRAVEAIRPSGGPMVAASALQAQALRQRQEDEALLLLLS